MYVYACLTVTNLALNKPARQISTYAGEVAGKAVDGRYDTRSCTVSDVHPWWTVDLGSAYSVSHVTVTNDGSPGNYRQTYCIPKSSTNQMLAAFQAQILNKMQRHACAFLLI